MSSLYDVRVSMHEGSTSSSSKLASEFLAEREEQEAASTEQADHIDFSAGNPRVEHLTGTVHLYRQVPSRADAESHRPDALPVGQPSFPLHHCCMSPALKPASKEGRSERLCVLALPLGMCVADFCAFVGGYLPSVREMRLVRRSDESSVCLVLLRFKDRPTADLFYIDFNNRAFSSLEPHVCCRLVYVRDVALTTAGIASSAHLPPPAGQTELPTCPVCLERLDEHVSGVVTTVCNHRFHNECLQRWGDTKCPVCRYCAQSSNDQSKCNSCSSTQDLWICLICGHIGCGRYHSKHAVAHWRETQHCYALDLETQRVWDYASDGYVHRLVQSKSDGKLVEVPSPGPSSGEAELAPAENELVQAAVQSKRDEMDCQIDQLLWSQSESMRNFWEDQLAEQAEQAQFQVKALQAKAEKLQLAAEQALAEKREAEQQRKASERAAHNTKQALDAKVAELTAKRDRLQVERDFLKTTSSNLLNNQKDWKDMLSAEKCRVIEQDAEIASLKEQVRDLMVFLDVQQQVQQQGGGELEGGTVLPVPEQPQPARRRGRGRGR